MRIRRIAVAACSVAAVLGLMLGGIGMTSAGTQAGGSTSSTTYHDI